VRVSPSLVVFLCVGTNSHGVVYLPFFRFRFRFCDLIGFVSIATTHSANWHRKPLFIQTRLRLSNAQPPNSRRSHNSLPTRKVPSPYLLLMFSFLFSCVTVQLSLSLRSLSAVLTVGLVAARQKLAGSLTAERDRTAKLSAELDAAQTTIAELEKSKARVCHSRFLYVATEHDLTLLRRRRHNFAC
jgi:hypothetical protein